MLDRFEGVICIFFGDTFQAETFGRTGRRHGLVGGNTKALFERSGVTALVASL
jgi:hypothetical protein